MKKTKYPIIGYIVFAVISTLVWISAELEFLPKSVGIIAAGLGLFATFLGTLSLRNNFQKEIKKEFSELKQFCTQKIDVREQLKHLKSLIVKKLCVSICDYTQYTVLIDFAKGDNECAEEIEQGLKKEGIKCDQIRPHEKSDKNILEQKLLTYQVIITIYRSVPEPWITARNAAYTRIIARARNTGIVPPTIIVCTTKDREHVKQLIKSAEIIDLNQPDYKKELLNAIKSKFKTPQ
jgi:uncharacterized membrane protein